MINRMNAAILLLVVAIAGEPFAFAAPDAPWQEQAHPYRMLLDWRPDDMKRADQTAELFLETSRFASATKTGEMSPRSFCFVAEKADGSTVELPFDSRQELGQSNRNGVAFRMVPPPDAKRLWMYFGGAESNRPALVIRWNLLDGALDSSTVSKWQSNSGDATVVSDNANGATRLRIIYDDKKNPAAAPMSVEVSRLFPVPEQARGIAAKVAIDLQSTGAGYVPMAILLKQLDQDGKEVGQCVVDPRWLTMCVAKGQKIQLREAGLIDPRAATITVSIRLNCKQMRDPIMDGNGSWQKFPPTDAFEMEISKAEIRAAQPILFPGFAKQLFAPGASGAADDLSLVADKGIGFCFDANPPAVWSEGRQPADPAAYHWPRAAGTFECWIDPQWNVDDGGKRELLNAQDGIGATHSALEIFYTPSEHKFHVIRDDRNGKKTEQVVPADLATKQWHHVAYIWDPAGGKQQLFVDGQKVMSHEGDSISAIDVANVGSAKAIPGRVWIGQSPNINHPGDDSLHCYIDEVRISDGVRYTDNFTPTPARFAVDNQTRALFHFDGRKDGIHAGDDERIVSAIRTPAPQIASSFEFEKLGQSKLVTAQWLEDSVPDAFDPQQQFKVKSFDPPVSASAFATSFTEHQQSLHLKPGESATIHCDSQPRMDWVEIRCPEGSAPIEAPFLAKPGEADARSMTKLAESLGVPQMSSDKQKADAVFRYLDAANNYYWTDTMDVQASGGLADPGSISTLNLAGYMQFGCGQQNTMVRDAFLAAGLSADLTHGSTHLFEQVFYDGAWHLYDLCPRVFFPARDNARAAALSEIEQDPYLVVRGTGDPLIAYWLPSDTRQYNVPPRAPAMPEMTYRLRPGESLRYYWQNDGRYNPILFKPTEHCVQWKEGPSYNGKPLYWATHFPPYSANGVFSFSCTPSADHPALSDWHDGAFIYKFASAFVVCGDRLVAKSANGSSPSVEISFDEGKKWLAAPKPDKDGAIDFDRLCADHHLYWFRVTPAAGDKVAHFEHQAIVLMNPKVLTPMLAQGDNALHFSADAGPTADVTVHYREESPAPLEIEGGVRFGWVEGNERQLLVTSPGNSLTFDVKGAKTKPTITGLSSASIKVESNGGDGQWRVKVDVPESCHDTLCHVVVHDGDRTRSAAVLIAKGAQLARGSSAKMQGRALLVDDPEGVHGQVVSLPGGATTSFPIEGANGPVIVFALAKIPQDTPGDTVLSTAHGPTPLIERNFAHTYWEQEYLLHQWKWYYPRAGGYPYETPATVQLSDPVVSLKNQKGMTLVDAVLILPVTNEALTESVTQYLFSANYEPWAFERDWGPITTGAAYPTK